jgi:uncharacterized protein (UPF0335 family)
MRKTETNKKSSAFLKLYSVRLDTAAAKKVARLRKGRASQNQVFVDAIEALYREAIKPTSN